MWQYKEARTFHETPSYPPPVGGRERHAVLSTYRRLVSVTVKKHGATHKTNTYREEKKKRKRRESTEEEGFNSQDTRAKHATEEGHHHRGRDEE